MDKPEKASAESTNTREISEEHVANAESIRAGRTSKASSNRATCSYVLAASATVLVSAILFVNIWGYIRS